MMTMTANPKAINADIANANPAAAGVACWFVSAGGEPNSVPANTDKNAESTATSTQPRVAPTLATNPPAMIPMGKAITTTWLGHARPSPVLPKSPTSAMTVATAPTTMAMSITDLHNLRPLGRRRTGPAAS